MSLALEWKLGEEKCTCQLWVRVTRVLFQRRISKSNLPLWQPTHLLLVGPSSSSYFSSSVIILQKIIGTFPFHSLITFNLETFKNYPVGGRGERKNANLDYKYSLYLRTIFTRFRAIFSKCIFEASGVTRWLFSVLPPISCCWLLTAPRHAYPPIPTSRIYHSWNWSL